MAENQAPRIVSSSESPAPPGWSTACVFLEALKRTRNQLPSGHEPGSPNNHRIRIGIAAQGRCGQSGRVAFAIGDIAAPIASGSYITKGMIVAPCSVRTMSEIATGVTSTLLTRAADVMLKKTQPLTWCFWYARRRYIWGSCSSLVTWAEWGAVILPPVPAFYAAPRTLENLVGITRLVARSIFSGMIGRSSSVGAKAAPAPGKSEMTGEVTAPDEVALRAKLAELTQEHRDLDAAIDALIGTRDMLQLTRLKKRKLQLKDQITKKSQPAIAGYYRLEPRLRYSGVVSGRCAFAHTSPRRRGPWRSRPCRRVFNSKAP